MALHVEIVDREGSVWSGDADYVSVPSVDGNLGILPGRQPILVVMEPGEVRVKPVGQEQYKAFPVQRGFSSVDSDAVTVVVERELGTEKATP